MKKRLWLAVAGLLVAVQAQARSQAQEPPPPAQTPPGPSASASTTVAEARAMLERLVSFRSVARTPEVARMADYLAGEFRRAGFAEGEVERVTTGEATGLIVRYRADPARAAASPIVFLAHMDVVDANRAEWASDPWRLTEKDGALHGRGVVDNKYGVLTLAQAFIRLKREGFRPARDLVLAFTGDEESGMANTRALAERLRGAAFAINADAGGGYRGPGGAATYIVQAGEKTYATFELTVRNRGGHSSRPRADHAIYELARLLQRIERHSFPARWNAITLESFRALLPSLPEPVAKPLAAFLADPSEEGANAVAAADPSFVPEVRTTCTPTLLRAGSVENALATEATATINCRIFPGETVAETRATLERVAAHQGLEVRTLGEPVEGPVSDIPPEALAALKTVLKVRAPVATISPYLEAGATDGVHFRLAGIATVGMGPLFATDASDYNFHGIDERLPTAEFEDGLEHFYLMMKALGGEAE